MGRANILDQYILFASPASTPAAGSASLRRQGRGFTKVFMSMLDKCVISLEGRRRTHHVDSRFVLGLVILAPGGMQQNRVEKMRCFTQAWAPPNAQELVSVSASGVGDFRKLCWIRFCRGTRKTRTDCCALFSLHFASHAEHVSTMAGN